MSGLLRRLARQATGRALPRIHAPARLPYHAAPDFLAEEMPRTATTLARPARQAPGVPDPASLPTDATVEPATAPTTAGTMAPGATSIDTPLLTPLIGEIPSVDRGDMSDPTLADAMTPTPVRSTPLPTDAAPIAAQAMPPSPEAEFVTHTTAVRAEETPDSRGERLAPLRAGDRVEETAPSTASTKIPATTLPTFGTPPESERLALSPPPDALLLLLAERQPPPRSPSMPSPSATAEGRVEVHVHIGRIEVTAVPTPTPAKPPAARGRKPMSLDEYLARRAGHRS
ncbi:hypothetical protein ACM26W_17155 [Halomonas sp. HK25]|uniref:hypothetical protein n=1 Tax=Halomonas sp. HK25 TaxID=3394321 RepID=UPI0039FD10FA